MIIKNKYSFSFTGASAIMADTLVIAEEYIRLGDWNKVKLSIQENNLMRKLNRTHPTECIMSLKKG